MIEELSGENWTIKIGDVFDGLATLANSSIHCCVTSPPYWGLRNYGFEGQIGSEKTPDEFVAKLLEVFGEVRRVLRDDGVLFVNLGDSYATGGGSIGRSPGGGERGERFLRAGMIDTQPNRMSFGMTSGNKIGVPWRFALAMQDAGWILRQDVIWQKPAPMPESVSGWQWRRCRIKIGHTGKSKQTTAGPFPEDGAHRNGRGGSGGDQIAQFQDCPGCDKCRDTGGMILRRGSWRPTTSHEYIFQFVKSQNYFCDGDGSKEATSGKAHHRGVGINPKSVDGAESRQNGSFSAAVTGTVETRNMRSVWRITTEGYKGAHFATYPTELVRRCLISATSRGGCCSACGAQYAPVVESKRTATRPGTNSKVNQVSPHEDSPYHDHSGIICGNRDPQRHTTTTVVTGYLPTCTCNAEKARPTVLDCFGGSMTTGQVAINMGCDFIGLEGNPEYAQLGVKRLETPWVPVADRKKPKGSKRRRKHPSQREMF